MTEHAEIERILKRGDEELFVEADAERQKWCGNAVHLRGIVELSNVCSRNCLYCGLRRDNTALPRYNMSVEEVLAVVGDAEKQGFRTIVLQSGENDAEQPERLAQMVFAIKREFDVAVTLCVGDKPADYYYLWAEAGADRYLLKHEAATRELYSKFHPDSRIKERLSALARLRALGYQVGTGCIIGLPGQTTSDLAQDILLTRELDVDMAAFGPFVPHPDTPLCLAAPGDLALSLRVVAIARLALGPVHIPATTSFDAIEPDGRERALRCGANVIMADLTPKHYRRLYDIYPSDRLANSIERVKMILERLNRPLAADQGHSLKRYVEKQSCREPQKA